MASSTQSRIRFASSVLAFALASLSVSAQSLSMGQPEILRNVGITQKLNGQVPLDATFLDETGKTVHLGDYFKNGKPVVLALIYYTCPMLCNLELDGLVESLRKISLVPGSDYQVVAVSFDPRDTPQVAAAKKRTYLSKFSQPGAANGLHFLTGKDDQIHRVTEAAGFRYAYDKRQNQYAHASGIMVATPEGRLARYFYGIHYNTRDLRLGLVEASNNKIGSPADEILLCCFRYDPTTGRYGFFIVNLLRVVGGLFAIGLFVWLFLSLRGAKAAKRRGTIDQHGHWRSV